ncbi:MAG: hypothetical protein L6Q37_11885 [Bdellovibrionaceae bacterium]|nr:hypothetical protein [Pseudobdellovibrionaceae bacterium]NUM59931.1 hypothetical protein [Pseudobdellovibrionaceae bacterium]
MKSFVALIFIMMIFETAFAVKTLKLKSLFASKSFLVEGNILLPQGQKLNKTAPSNITVLEKIDGQWKEVTKIELTKVFTVSEEFPYSFPVHTQSNDSPIKITASLYHCDKVKNNYCVIDDFEGEVKRSDKFSQKSLSIDLKGSSPK